MTKRIIICMIGITALLLWGCSQTKDMTDDKNTLAEILPKFNKIYHAIDCGSMDHGNATVSIDGNTYHLICEPGYTSVADIRDLLQQIYTDSHDGRGTYRFREV